MGYIFGGPNAVSRLHDREIKNPPRSVVHTSSHNRRAVCVEIVLLRGTNATNSQFPSDFSTGLLRFQSCMTSMEDDMVAPASNAMCNGGTHKRDASANSSQEPLTKKFRDNRGKVVPKRTRRSPVTTKITDEESFSPTVTSVSPSTTTTATDATIVQPNGAAEQTEEESPGGRRPRRRATAVAMIASAETVESPRKPLKKTKVEDTEEEFNTAWICCECNEAECMMVSDAQELIICEGSCRRLFHYPCAGLAKPPLESDTFVCQDCQQGRHMCAFCQNYGYDGEDVFPCSSDKCGLFFHEACLEMNGVEVQLIKTTAATGNVKEAKESDDEDMDTKHFRREFLCPAHQCWTCTQDDLLDKEKKEAAEARKSGKRKGQKKSRSTGTKLFGRKKDKTLIRCLVCPNSYHTSCIPPTARFNELSLLCPEHATTHRLPEVDPESSLQNELEKKIDVMYLERELLARRKHRRLYQNNPFFYGKSGDVLSEAETELKKELDPDSMYGLTDVLPFCIPVALRDEVHSKPPFYKHIHSNKYDADHSPPRVELTPERCNCLGHCDRACLNRLLYVECNGKNCSVGKHCGNRAITQRKFKKCQPKREEGKGWGLVVLEDVRKGDLVIEYVGEIIDEKAKEKCLRQWAEEHPNDPNFYVMALGQGWFIDARVEANFARFINHSCEPNSIVHTINVNGVLRNGIFALRDIPAGTFLSYDYHFETLNGDKFVCRCGSVKCRGTMKDRLVEGGMEKTKRQLWEDAKRDYDRDKAFLEDFHKKQAERRSQVDALVPEWEFPGELVANGPPSRHREDAVAGRIFLWRNAAQRGANFADRFARLEARKMLADKGTAAAKQDH